MFFLLSLFIFGYARSSLLHGFSLAASSRGSLQWLLIVEPEHGLEGVQASVVAACGLSSCDSWALEHGLSCSVACDLPDQGSNLCPCTGRFFTTEPPGKPSLELKILFNCYWTSSLAKYLRFSIS